jgi:hypothetical protein
MIIAIDVNLLIYYWKGKPKRIQNKKIESAEDTSSKIRPRIIFLKISWKFVVPKTLDDNILQLIDFLSSS